MLKPGATIGILGGGQLGRMLAVAAAQLGYRTHVLAPDEESVAAQTASSLTRADYHNKVVLADFVASNGWELGQHHTRLTPRHFHRPSQLTLPTSTATQLR